MPWSEYETVVGASSMMLGAIQYYQSRAKEKGIQPQNKTKRENYSWLPIYKFLKEVDANTYANIASHYVDGIGEVSQKPQMNISGDIVGQEISGYQLLVMYFSGRPHGSSSDHRARVYRRKRGACAVVSAMRGYLPAQAICSQLLGDSNDRFRKMLEDNDTKWQRKAVASGFLLVWEFAHENPEEYTLALSDFRQLGRYNAHYAYNTIEKESAYSPSGLLYDVQGPLEWLRNYPLHKAAALGQTAEVRLLEDNGYDINSLDISGETPLQRACMAGHASTTPCLVQRGANATLKSKLLGTVPLHWLFVFEPSEADNITDMLAGPEKENLNQESNVEADAFHFPFKWPSGSPIAWSVLSNRYEAISALLRLGSSLDSIPDFFPSLPEWPEDTDPYYDEHSNNIQKRNLFKAWIYNPILRYQHAIYQSSIKYVAERGALEGLEELSSNKLDSRIVKFHGGELQTAVAEGDLDAVQRLINSGADVNAPPSRDDTPLLAAISAKNPDIVKLLLENGAEVNYLPDAPTQGPLQRAANKGNMQIIRMLLDAGADVNGQSQKPGHTGTALYEASGWVGIDVVEMLLEKCANCDIIGGIYGTPLQRAAYPNIEGGYFWTALQAAVIPSRYRNHEILDILLERNVDVNAVGGDYGTAIQAAASSGDESVVEKLLRARALLNVRGGRHGTALRAAARSGNLKPVQLLLEAGADPDIGGGIPYKTPLEEAVVSGDEAMVNLLLSNGANPNLLGVVDKVLLRAEQQGRSVGGMEQILLGWGMRPNAENIPPASPLHPLS
ncbi:ankyrin repeat-containing domain protein [Tuber borchii]|uniref:Ankyrin repeat-containing domain protein n=1 Tax=Tuber borchii TaxID=42251 RepID=A0A2T6ZIC2_TUBBO|nr:ankyrin repeat-containing domain protein [Tuber borchii]